jgi:hypothetical protein
MQDELKMFDEKSKIQDEELEQTRSELESAKAMA